MPDNVYIFESTQANFDETVIQNSHKLPVITLFMGVWSEPCFELVERFSALAKEFAGRFILAKIDIDEQPELVSRYSIENVPSIKVIQNGQVVLTLEGLLTEEEARVLLKGVEVFHMADEMREQARIKHLEGDTETAIILLSEAIKEDPGNTRVALDMVQVFIDIKQFEQANGLFNRLPKEAQESSMGKAINGQLIFINLAAEKLSIELLIERLEKDPEDTVARFDLAICLTAEYEYEEALGELLVLQERDAGFRDGAGKELLLALISMLKSSHPELANKAQMQLSNLLSE